MTWRSWSLLVWFAIVCLVVAAILETNVAAMFLAGVFAVLWTHERHTRKPGDWPETDR